MESKVAPIVRVRMVPSGKQYDVLPGQSLLEAGLSAGIALPFGCANGSCGECRARVLTGQVKKIRTHDYLITEAQKLDGHCLLCSTTAITDIQLDALIATSVDDIPEQQLQAKLCRIEHMLNASIVAFKFTRSKALRFLPGQQVHVTLKCGNTIVLPIASCPCNAQYVEFHLTADSAYEVDLSRFGERAKKTAIERERISIRGPSGSFTLSSATRKPRLFIAVGGEFGQMQGMIEQVLNEELDEPCALVWKASDKVTHYRSNLCRAWHDAFDQFEYIPVASNDDVLSKLPNHWHSQLRSCEVYLGKMSSSLIQGLTNNGVDTASIFYPDDHCTNQ